MGTCSLLKHESLFEASTSLVFIDLFSINLFP